MRESKKMKDAPKSKVPYETPKVKKYDPLDIVRGSPSQSSSLYTGSLYTECSLYYYY